MGEKKVSSHDLTPDRRPLTPIQASRLAAASGLKAAELASLSIADISEKFRWRIDPELLLFRRVCGRVIKRDPATGTEYPVPFATVHVEDTDCNFLGLFPPWLPWVWFFPLFCKREQIGAVKTDACGRFCVWVPRFEVDWILRFRRERICFPEILIPPLIRDLLELLPEPPIIRRPPLPDPPPPILLQDGGLTLRRVEELVGREVAGQLAAMEAAASFGASTEQQLELLNRKAFIQPLPPPLPAEFKPVSQAGAPSSKEGAGAAAAKTMEAARATLATRLKLDLSHLARLDFRRFIGPFRRCFDILVPEWAPILDVPDITFRVTQDVNGDGAEEVIYSEGFFDVRWNAGPIPDVTLEASPIAVAGRVCDVPEVPCEKKPAILFAGLMPLVNPALPADPYIDAGAGYARRPNRPHPSGDLIDPLPNPLAETPFCRVLQVYGCNRIPKAAFYRLQYSYDGGAFTPFVGLSWPLYRVVGGVLQSHWPAADANGWYPVLPAADNWFPDLLLLEWPTGSYANGHYNLKLEIGDAAKAVIASSAAVALRIDNSRPSAQFTRLRWKRVADAAWQEIPWPFICPVLRRGAVPADIEIEVTYNVAASHLRSFQLTAGGCGGGNPVLTSAVSTAQHWHDSPADNNVTRTAVYSIAAANLAGPYSFHLFAASRAFNPSGGDGGHLADWNYDPVYLWVHPMLAVAVIDANP